MIPVLLKQEQVGAEEDRLREQASALPDDQRKAFFKEASRELRDPDTYAALNWLFLAGIHHFYLGRWTWGLLDLSIFLLGVGFIVAQQYLIGILLIALISILELWALFRAQIIVQDWNNGVYRRLLRRYSGTGRQL
ncbi:TM2 domain-containing protein [Gilvimarinus sp. F26214L]|uniref:TM2 domain-containing protein n=1 Tax=Gilvimarinus sp. DZF01 TaxID=3461371 RepID=UPI00404584B7